MDPIEHQNISEYLQEASLEVSADQLQKLQIFHRMLRQENERINVTRLYSAEAMGRKHYVDSLMPIKLLAESNIHFSSPCMDLGSGGGFPGIPLAICQPGIIFRLVEGRKKRTEFLTRVCERLDLNNVEVISRKLNASDRIECNTAISRAFMSISDTLNLSRLSVNPGGLFIFWKGPDCDEEIAEAQASAAGWVHNSTIEYTLPGTRDQRRLVIFNRAASQSGPDAAGAGPATAQISFSDKHGIPGHLQSRVHAIESEANPRFKEWQKLDQSKWIKRTGLTIVGGRKLVPEALSEYVESVAGWNGKPAALLFHDTLPLEFHRLLESWPDLPLFRLKADLFRRLDSAGTQFPLLLWDLTGAQNTPAIGDLPELASSQAQPPDRKNPQSSGGENVVGARQTAWLVLPLSLPENLGAAIRTARGFGIHRVLLTQESVFPFHPGVIRSSSGASLRMPFAQLGPLESVSDALTEAGISSADCLALDHKANRPLSELSAQLHGVTGPAVFIVGQEGPGLPDSVSATRFRIPISGLESFNAVVSVTALLYEWRRLG